jgi:hypothetical protein
VKPFLFSFENRIKLKQSQHIFFCKPEISNSHSVFRVMQILVISKTRLKVNNWDNTPLFVKYNPGLLDLLVLLDETGLQTGL